MQWSLTFEPVVRVTLTLTVVIWRQTRDGQEGFKRSDVNFTNMYSQISHEEHNQNSVRVTKRQILTHLSVQCIKEGPLPLRDVVSTLDIDNFFSLFFPRLVQ